MRRYVLESLLAATLVAGIGFHGATPEWARAVFMTVAFTMFAGYALLLDAKSGLELPSPRCLAFCLSILAVPVLQILPLPAALQKFVTPCHAQLMEKVAQEGIVGSSILHKMVSVFPYATLSQILLFTALTAIFLIARTLLADIGSLRRLTAVLTVIGLLEALYGLSQYFNIMPQWIPAADGQFISMATGTYVNRNHFAGLLEMLLPLTLGTAYAYFYIRIFPQINLHQPRLRQFLVHPRLPFFLLIIFTAICMALGVLYSLSRGGILFMVAGFGFMSLLMMWKHRKRTVHVVLVMFALIVAGYAVWIGLDSILARWDILLTQKEFAGEGRGGAWQDTLTMIGDFPVLGVGLGAYYPAFGRYFRAPAMYVFDHAHNDYLEYTAELGIPGALLLFGVILWLFIRGVWAFLRADNQWWAGLALGASGGIFCILLHSLTDFNLQIPGNMAVFAFLLAAVAAAAQHIGAPAVEEEEEEEEEYEEAAPAER